MQCACMQQGDGKAGKGCLLLKLKLPLALHVLRPVDLHATAVLVSILFCYCDMKHSVMILIFEQTFTTFPKVPLSHQ